MSNQEINNALNPAPRPFLWLAVIGFATLLLLTIVHLYRLDAKVRAEKLAKQEQQRITETIAEVKAGRTHVSIHSPELVTKLADDADCIRNVSSVYFFMTELSDPRYAEVTRLTNLREVAFYDCGSVEVCLASIKGMPSIESLYLESVRLSDDMLQSLASFPNLKKVRFEQLLGPDQIDLLASTVPNAIVEIPDDETGEPKQILGGTP